MINRERMLAEFFELVKITCSTRKEREVADIIKEKLAAMGGQVSEDNTGDIIGGTAGNVFAYFPGTNPGALRILFSAHMDSVEPCAGIQPVLANGVITSDGDTILGADDKAGVAAILEGLRTVIEQDLPRGDIQVIFTVAEEGGLNGSKHLDPARLTADMGFILDSSGAPGKIIITAPGQNQFSITVYGKTAHAGIAPEEGVNAIVVAGHALAALQQGRIDFETTANIGRISGGGATNIVTDKVEITAEARSRNPEKLAAQTKHMVETFETVAAAHGGRADVQVKKSYDPFVLHEDMPVVRICRQAAEAMGLPVSLEGTGGGSDANYFNRYGVPSAVLGVGMSKVHTNDEYIKEEHLYQSAELVMSIVRQSAAGRR